MLSPGQQKTIWEGWLGAEIRSYYFADLSGRYRRRQTGVTWVLLACSSGAFAALIAGLPSGAGRALTFLTAILSLWSVVAQNQKHVTDCADLHFRWLTLASRYEALWNDMYDPGAAATLRQLTQIAAEISTTSTAFPNDAKRMGKWQDLVEAHHHAALSA